MILNRNMTCACLLLGWGGLASAQTLATGVGNAQLDPQTGQLIAPDQPQKLILTPDEQNSMSSSHDGLREQALPDGGYALDLQGRFQNSVFATVNRQGQARIDHALPHASPEERNHVSH